MPFRAGSPLTATTVDTSGVDDVLDIGHQIGCEAEAAVRSVAPVLAADVCVEQFLRAFSTGSTNATTLFQLAQVISVARYVLWSRLGVRPRVAYSQSIRSVHSLPDAGDGLDAHPGWSSLPPLPASASSQRMRPKLAPILYAAARLGGAVVWPTSPRGLLRDTAFDIADACLCASYARAAAVGDAAAAHPDAAAVVSARAAARARRSPAALARCLRSAGIKQPRKDLRGDAAAAALQRSPKAAAAWEEEEVDRVRHEATAAASRLLGL